MGSRSWTRIRKGMETPKQHDAGPRGHGRKVNGFFVPTKAGTAPYLVSTLSA